MAHRFLLPDVGEGLVEATVLTWYVEVGEAVALDQPLVEVETDKTTVDIPSPYAGVLLHRGGEEGDTVAVDEVLAVVGEPGESWEETPDDPAEDTYLAQDTPVVGSLPEADEGLPAPVLPMVRRLATELGVDLSTLFGTGPRGRITESDVRNEASGGAPIRPPMPRIRRKIAENLARSWREIPHVPTLGRARSDGLMAQRSRLGKPPIEALLIARLTPVLARFPAFNSVVDGDHILERRFFHFGFAVEAPEGLMVAVVRDADTFTVEELADEVRRLVSGAKAGSLSPDEVQGQTFTVSNIGAVGGGLGTPIIPYGTSAILSVGRAEPAPVVEEDRIEIVRQFPLSLSYDHRLIDGALGRRFLDAVVEALEG